MIRSMSPRTLFIAALVLTAVWRGLAINAQQTAKVLTIGYLSSGTREVVAPNVEALRRGLREPGYVGWTDRPGQGVAVDWS
jgi:hypothetical protein